MRISEVKTVIRITHQVLNHFTNNGQVQVCHIFLALEKNKKDYKYSLDPVSASPCILVSRTLLGSKLTWRKWSWWERPGEASKDWQMWRDRAATLHATRCNIHKWVSSKPLRSEKHKKPTRTGIKDIRKIREINLARKKGNRRTAGLGRQETSGKTRSSTNHLLLK